MRINNIRIVLFFLTFSVLSVRLSAQNILINFAQYYADKDQLELQFNENLDPLVSVLSGIGLCTRSDGMGAINLSNSSAMILETGETSTLTLQITDAAMVAALENDPNVRSSLFLQVAASTFFSYSANTNEVITFSDGRLVTYFDFKPNVNDRDHDCLPDGEDPFPDDFNQPQVGGACTVQDTGSVTINYSGPLYGTLSINRNVADQPALAFYLLNTHPFPVTFSAFHTGFNGSALIPTLGVIKLYKDRADEEGFFGTFNAEDSLMASQPFLNGNMNLFNFSQKIDPGFMTSYLVTIDFTETDSTVGFDFYLSLADITLDQNHHYVSVGSRSFKKEIGVSLPSFYFNANYSDTDKTIHLIWGNLDSSQTVESIQLFRNDTLRQSGGATFFSYQDAEADFKNHQAYKLIILYQNAKQDTFFTDYYYHNTACEWTPFCGTVAEVVQLLSASYPILKIPCDTVTAPLTITGSPFLDSQYGSKVLVLGTTGTGTDTLFALGAKDSCSQPLLQINGTTRYSLFMRVKDMPRPYFYVWYNDTVPAMRCQWGNLTLDGRIDSLQLFRDLDYLDSFDSTVFSYYDGSADRNRSYQYHIVVYYSDSHIKYFYYDYGSQNNGNDWWKERKYAAWTNYGRDISSWTGLVTDQGRSGLLFSYFLNADSIPDTTTINLTFAIKANADTAYTLIGSTTAHPTNDSVKYFKFYDTLLVDYYQTRTMIHYTGHDDTLVESFSSGWLLRVSYGQKISVDLKKLARIGLGLSAEPSMLSGYTVNGSPAALPTGNLYVKTSTARNMNDSLIRITYSADNKPFDFALSLKGPFDSGLWEAGPALSSEFMTLDGNVMVKISGEGFDQSNPSDSLKRMRTVFTQAALSCGSRVDTVRFPLDSSHYRFNTGTTTGNKKLFLRAFDVLAGITLEGSAGQIFHLGATEKSVIGRLGTVKRYYYTVGEAVRAGEKDILLSSTYKGIPIAFSHASGITITGNITDTAKTKIYGDSNMTALYMDSVDNMTIRGLDFRNGRRAGAGLEGCQSVTFEQCRFYNSYMGLYAFRTQNNNQNDGSSHNTTPNTPVRKIRVVNSIFDKTDGVPILFDLPESCSVVNNTLHRAWIGAYFGSAGSSDMSTALNLIGNLVVNNIFDSCSMGGVVIGKRMAADAIAVSVKNNLFKSCDSGAVVTILQPESNGWIVLSATRPTTNLATTLSIFETGRFPYLASASPAKDAGANNILYDIPRSDFRGASRFVQDTLPDIGAIEMSVYAPGITLVEQCKGPGFLHLRAIFVQPGLDSGTFYPMSLMVKKEGVLFTPVKLLSRTTDQITAFDLYPLPDGVYQVTLQARVVSALLDSTYSLVIKDTLTEGIAVLPAESWVMAGYADSAISMAKAASRLSLLNDSTLFSWDSYQERYLDYLDSSGFQLERGRAYWNWPAGDIVLSMPSNMYAAPDTAPFSFFLTTGWHMLSSPYPFPVSLNTGSKAYYYDADSGSYCEDEILKPLIGAFYFSPVPETLLIGYLPYVSSPLRRVLAKGLYKDADEWALQMDVELNGRFDRGNAAGVKPGAKDAFNPRMDQPEPPPPFGKSVRAWFEDQDKGMALSESYRKAGPGTRTWNLTIDPQGQSGPIHIKVSGAETFPDDCFIFSGSLEKGISDIKAVSDLTINTSGEKKSVILVVTDNPDFLSNLNDELTLAQNSPNPFNPSTRIVFSIPYHFNGVGALVEKQRVRLSVLDIRGRVVAELLNKPLSAGKGQAVVWNADSKGRAVSSGVYFCRLECGGKTLLRKMVLAR
ncbi:MAG: hypothetical protein A2293_11810 [Elusimicrobia bacterium RIFOXYB2_FULL_49_7]|nr:MAG: hypothetical protein A2293_11810 [Elusimicrobia bacterium RIFOXYB2_FULL_49_7]